MKYTFYCVINEEELTYDMIKESCMSLNPKAELADIVQHEKGLRVLKDKLGNRYVLKFSTKFPTTCQKFRKYSRDELNQELNN